MNISDILSPVSIRLSLKAENKNNLLDKMLNLAAASGKIINRDEVRKEIFEREKIMSTGIGEGVALPHAKSNSVRDMVGSFAILEKPVNFDSLDNEPVKVVFLLISRENNVGNHLRLISKISRILNDKETKDRILNASDPNEVLKIFSDAEESD